MGMGMEVTANGCHEGDGGSYGGGNGDDDNGEVGGRQQPRRQRDEGEGIEL